MQSLRNASPLLHLTLAVLFAVMSLFHGPVMTFAKAAPAHAPHETAVPVAAHQHHAPVADAVDAAGDLDWLPGSEPTPLPAACNAVGCFVALNPPPVGAPLETSVPLGTLSPACASVIDPASPDPAVPPPRLQV
jgi:hypothetical protein